MSWSPQQDAALLSVKHWLDDKSGPQIFRLFGYAGSGKTTLAKEIASCVRGLVLYACFTGKAALVLRKKGCADASTIHSCIYQPIQDEDTGHVEFILNPDSKISMAKLVIIDEVSMVDAELARDLLSYGTRVLVLGDPAQLPPVKGEGFFINAAPDVMLTEVHRQAAENPIIRLSMDVREGRMLLLGDYGEAQVLMRRDVDKDHMRKLVTEADQLLCGMNKTRHTFNARMRDINGMAGRPDSYLPTVGDRLVCLKNNKEKGLLNGGLWSVTGCTNMAGKAYAKVKSLDDEYAEPAEIMVPYQFFNGTEAELDWREKKRVDEFTYGNCLTVHKSQGSQFDNVVLFDESGVFRENAAKHLYTGITRAAERLTVVV